MIQLDSWLDHLRTHLVVARAGVDPEGVHQVRVASRRLAVWVQLRGGKALVDDLRWLRGRAGAVRDLDVLLERKPPRGWARWLADQRRDARASLLEALADRRLAGLIESLSLLPPLDEDEARSRLPRVAHKVLTAGDALAAHSRDIDALHRLRRRMRRLRYALDWMGDETDIYSSLQSVFGDVADLSLGLDWLARYPGADRLAGMHEAWAADLDRTRKKALRLWRGARRHVQALA